MEVRLPNDFGSWIFFFSELMISVEMQNFISIFSRFYSLYIHFPQLYVACDK